MVEVTWRYAVGQQVLAGGVPGAVECRSHNVNWLPVYLVNGRWWFEGDLSIPCPV